MAKRRKDKAYIYTQGLAPTKERQRQNGGVLIEVINEKDQNKIYKRRHRAAFSCIIDAYFWHEVISEPEYKAAQKFGREYARSVYKIKIYDTGGGGHGEYDMAAISAIKSNEVLREAFQLLTPVQINLLISVCVDNNRVGINRGLKLLRKSLQVLAARWKML